MNASMISIQLVLLSFSFVLMVIVIYNISFLSIHPFLWVPVHVCLFFTDINESRLKVAKELGADYVVKVTTRDPQAIAKAIEDAVGDKVDISMECSGVLNSQQAAVYVSKVSHSLCISYHA